MYRSLVALLTAAPLFAAPGVKEKDGPKKADPALVGEWVVEKAVVGGKEKPVRPGSGLTVTADGRMTLTEGGINQKLEGPLTIDPTKAPAALDFTPDGPAAKGVPFAGIYKIEGDTLTVCLVIGADRPARFEAPAGDRLMLMTLKRAKKE